MCTRPGAPAVRRRAQRQAVVPLVDTQEAHPHRAELRRGGDPERAARQKAEHLGVEVEAAVRVHRRQHDVAETLCAGDELGAERGDHRAVVEHRAVEDLERRAGRVLEGDDLLDPRASASSTDSGLTAMPGGLELVARTRAARMVTDLPADGHDLVGVAGDDHDAAARSSTRR